MIKLIITTIALLFSSHSNASDLKCSEYQLEYELVLFDGLENLIEAPTGSRLKVFDQTGNTALVEIYGPKGLQSLLEGSFVHIDVDRLKHHTCIPAKKPAQAVNAQECSIHQIQDKSIEGIPPKTVVKNTGDKSHPSWATEVEYYQEGEKKKKILSKEILKDNTQCLETSNICQFRELSGNVNNLKKGTVVEILKSESWYHVIQYIDSEKKVQQVKVGQEIMKEHSTCTIYDPAKFINMLAPSKPCTPDITSSDISNSYSEPIPNSTPNNFTKDPYWDDRKSQTDLDEYLSCYKRTKTLHKEYMTKYKGAISNVVDAFIDASNHEYDTQEIKSIFTCLLFRESSQWDSSQSYTGAVGFGQFTNDGIEEVESLFKKFPYKEKAIKDDLKWLENRKTKTREIRGRIATVRALKTNLYRHSKIKEFYNKLREKETSLPDFNTSDAEIDRILTKKSLSDKKNYKLTFAMSMAKMMNCVSQYRSYFDKKEVSPKSKVFMACAGAYNIGTTGFRDNVLGTNRDVNFEDWMKNLENSGDNQRHETRSHLISIQRCADSENNYPTCGTHPNNRCFKNNYSVSPCDESETFICHKEDKNRSEVIKECDPDYYN